MARTPNGELALTEVDKSREFANFYELTGGDLANDIFKKECFAQSTYTNLAIRGEELLSRTHLLSSGISHMPAVLLRAGGDELQNRQRPMGHHQLIMA